MPKIATLTFNAKREILDGLIGTELSFYLEAYSGGSRGHSNVNPATAKNYLHSQENSMYSRFANTQTVGSGSTSNPYKQRGGTLPPGHYSCVYVANHPHFHQCIKLNRDADTYIRYPTASGVSLNTRGDDFFIHASGPKGSDGCIVVMDNQERHRLNLAVKNFDGKVILLVKDVAYLLPAERDDVMLA